MENEMGTLSKEHYERLNRLRGLDDFIVQEFEKVLSEMTEEEKARFQERRPWIFEKKEFIFLRNMLREDRLSAEEKAFLDEITKPENADLQILKRNRTHPEIGDIFEFKLLNGMEFHGVVLNANIKNSQGEGKIVIAALKNKIEFEKEEKILLNESMLLMIFPYADRWFWTSGRFRPVGKLEIDDFVKTLDYGFLYSGYYLDTVACFVDEYDQRMDHIPKFYAGRGIVSSIGIGRGIVRELYFKGEFPRK